MPVEQVAIEPRGGLRQHVAAAHIGRIADDGGELLVLGQGEEVEAARPRRTHARVEFASEGTGFEKAQEGTIAAGRLQDAPAAAAQAQHGAHHGLGREHLPQRVRRNFFYHGAG